MTSLKSGIITMLRETKRLQIALSKRFAPHAISLCAIHISGENDSMSFRMCVVTHAEIT